MKRSLVSRGFLLLITGIMLAGCGDGTPQDLPEMAKVTGTVKLDGMPLADAQVTFIPEKGPVATGKTDSDGNFTLSTKDLDDGAVVGNHKISVTKATGPPPEPTGADSYAIPAPGQTAGGIPSKYADTTSSGLKATIEAGKENVVPVDLSSK